MHGTPRIPVKALNRFKKYMEKTWIVGKLHAISVYKQELRTNNHTEAYNKKWNSRVQVTNPNMWKLGETIFAAFMDVEKEMGRLDNNLTITRPKARKNVLNARRLKKAEEKLESEEYSSREFLRAVTYSFNVTNDKYFDEWAAEEWETLENGTDSDDSENEAVTPEPYQDLSDEEVTFPKHQTQQESTVTCDICMDREPDVFIVPCGHQNMCGPCAHQEKELRGKCPYDMKLIQQIIPKIPM